jgi:hypothetical protein
MAGVVVRMGYAYRRNEYTSLVAKPESKSFLVDLSVDGRIILKCIVKKYGVKMWTGFIWIRIKSSGGLL